MNDNISKEDIPEKFKDSETGALKAEALLKSYGELEKKMSSAPKVPKTPQDYCIDCGHGLFEVDEEMNKRLHEKGFTQDQAQEVYDLAAEKFVPMVAEMSRDVQADREVEKLVAHFGGVDQWREVSRQLLAFGHQNLPADMLESLSSSFEGILALEKMMRSEEPALKSTAETPNAANADDLKNMMRDPRYWKAKDPAFVSKVTEGFQKIYGA